MVIELWCIYIYITLSRISLGCSLTDRTSANSVGRFRQLNGIELTTSDSDSIDVDIRMTSCSSWINESISLMHHRREFIQFCVRL